MRGVRGIHFKACTSCKVDLPFEKFKARSVHGRQTGQRSSMCNRCLYVKYTRPDMERKAAIIKQYKLDQGCTDCGYNAHSVALEFDHLPGTVKLFNVGQKIGTWSMAKLMAEIAKCEVVCANCHAVRTEGRWVRVGIEKASKKVT